MARFNRPASPQRNQLTIETFRGVDLNNSPTNVDKSRSPAAPNMIRDQVGKVRKRMGYQTIATAPGRINGVYQLEEKTLIHAGGGLYDWDGAEHFKKLGNMADVLSTGFIWDKKLYLLDGHTYRVCDGKELTAAKDSATVPDIIINKNPDGTGGQTYQALNLLTNQFREDFLATGTDKTYHLSMKELDSVDKVELLKKDGEWEKTTGYTADLAAGTVTFKTAPSLPAVAGADNVRITASKEREGGDQINGCRFSVLYGVNGATDRVFMSGNADKPGYDWYSEFEDPLYFPATGYTQLSREGAPISGYAVLGNTLATFISGATDARNVIVRRGDLDSTGNPTFQIINTLTGESAVAPLTFTARDNEPLFLTNRGVYAITAAELTGEKYSQQRGYYISEALQAEQGKESAVAINYGDFYALALNHRIWFLDGKQKSYEKNAPYSSYQLECYYWPDIPARRLWMDGDALAFGTDDGRICKFGSNVDDVSQYNDDGKAIDAYWETSDMDGKTFFMNKTFRSVAVRLAAAQFTGVKIYALRRGIWGQIFDAKEKARFFDWEYIDFSKFVFSSDRTPRTLWGKIKVKKVDKVRFRLQNNALNEPFGLYAFGVEWTESGNYKR